VVIKSSIVESHKKALGHRPGAIFIALVIRFGLATAARSDAWLRFENEEQDRKVYFYGCDEVTE